MSVIHILNLASDRYSVFLFKCNQNFLGNICSVVAFFQCSSIGNNLLKIKTVPTSFHYHQSTGSIKPSLQHLQFSCFGLSSFLFFLYFPSAKVNNWCIHLSGLCICQDCMILGNAGSSISCFKIERDWKSFSYVVYGWCIHFYRIYVSTYLKPFKSIIVILRECIYCFYYHAINNTN